MNLRKAFNIFSYSNTVYLILFISFSNAELVAKYPDDTSTKSIKKYSLTAICIEIKPSSTQEEPYLMCKSTKFPYFQNTIYGLKVNDKEIPGSNRNFGPDGQIQPFRYFHNYRYNKKQDIDRYGLESQMENQSLLLFNQNKQIHVRHLQSSQTNSDISESRLLSTPKTSYDLRLPTAMPLLYRRLQHNSANKNPSNYENSNSKYIENNNSKKYVDSRITQNERSIGSKQLFPQSTISSFEGPKSNYANFFDYRDYNIKQNGALQETHSSPYIETTVPKHFLEVLASNDDTKQEGRQRSISDEYYRQAVNENSRRLPNLGLTLQELNYFRPSPELNDMKQIHMEPHTLPYADDTIMHQFYNSLYYSPLMTTKHPYVFLENPIDVPLSNHMSNIEPQYSTRLHSTCIPHTFTPIQGATESGLIEFRNAAISESVEPTNNYCKMCLPETRFTLHPIIIALPCYNRLSALPPPLSLMSYENCINENQYLNHPETTEFVGLPNSPLGNIFRTRLFPHFDMIPRLGGLLDSARPKQPALLASHQIFRNSKTLAVMPQQKTPPLRPQISPSSEFRPRSEDISVATHLDDMQTTILPLPTTTIRPAEVVVSTPLKSIEVVQESVKESTTSQENLIENLTKGMPIVVMKTDDLKTESQTKDIGEESTKKILTMIEKARRLQMRHKLD